MLRPSAYRQNLLTLFLALHISCDRPDCVNINPVFDKNKPESIAYKDELINELKSADITKITYWLKSYEEKHGREYLTFFVQGEGICALMEMEVNDWTGLEDLREKKALSYRGAQFMGLEYEVKRSEYETQFIYKAHERIID